MEEKATERLFYEDSHRKEFTATVLSCEEYKEGYRVVLDRTAFFPEGGGQFGDQGWLNGVEVTDTKEEESIIYHETKEPFAAGETVEGKLDFDERFARMQQHTGEHIISGIVHRMFGYDNVGFHLGAEVTTLDFNGELSEEQVREVEDEANKAVFSDLPIEILYPSQEELREMDYRSKIEIQGQVRIVTIPGIDRCACCAPHTYTTGEVGLIRLLSCERHRGGCRIVMVSGVRALEDCRKKQKSVTEVSVALSAPPEQIGAAVQHLKEQQGKLKERLNQMQAVYLQQKLEEILPGEQNVCIFEEELDHIAARNFVNDAMGRCSGVCGIFVGDDAIGYRYILGSSAVDVRVLSGALNARFQGKGGGKPQMVQGSLNGTKDEILKMVMEG